MSKRGRLNAKWASQKPTGQATEVSGNQGSEVAGEQTTEASSYSDSTVAKDQQAQRRGQTLRLTPDAWRQLKVMAAEQDRRAHDLLLEAVNDLFQKHGRPPIA